MPRLDGKTAVVTGVTSGIGQALTTRLLHEGANVAGIARNAEELYRQAATHGPLFTPVLADLADPQARAHAIDGLTTWVTTVDILVNNAAQCTYTNPLDLDLDGWRALLEVNLIACLDLTRRLAPLMDRGHIINISSVTARGQADAHYGPYATTKAALEAASTAIRAELAARGIKVCVLVPGLVDTPIYDKIQGFAGMRQRLQRRIPKWLEAADVADAVCWIVTQPDHVTVSELVLLPVGQLT